MKESRYEQHPCACWKKSKEGLWIALNKAAEDAPLSAITSPHFAKKTALQHSGGEQHGERMYLWYQDGEEVILSSYINNPEQAHSEEQEELRKVKEEQGRTREELENLLLQKETLVKEVHHRVKNNLQIISSILSLQKEQVDEPQFKDILQESRNRITAMSVIHESLYQGERLDRLYLRSYIGELVRNLAYTYLVRQGQIEIQLEVADVEMSLDQAIPFGLIVNELVSNALKYAFPDGKKGVLKVVLQEGENSLGLVVCDDGVGLPANTDIRTSDSLGLQLVCALTEQLDGCMEYSGQRGTRYLITFDKRQ